MRRTKFILLGVFIVLLIPIISIAKYSKKISNIKIGFQIAEPIANIEPEQKIIKKELKNGDEIEEFYFVVNNYNNNDTKKVSEVKFCYSLEIQSSNNEWPIMYNLYDCETGEELLKGRMITEKIFVDKNIEYSNRYKLSVNLSNNLNFKSKKNNNIDIVLNFVQEN